MRCSYRQILDRFSHIDAEFVSCALGFPEERPYYRVRFYPWWEHPLYLQARDAGAPWGFSDCEAGAHDVTVYPQGLVAFRVSERREVIDWLFTERSPLLWPFEPQGQIFLNDPIDRDELAHAIEERVRLGIAAVRDVLALAPGVAWKVPFSLRLPRSILPVVRAVLDDRGLGYHAAHVPPAEEARLVAFVVDGDYILARDFELDVPDFEHRPEWFDPRDAERFARQGER